MEYLTSILGHCPFDYTVLVLSIYTTFGGLCQDYIYSGAHLEKSTESLVTALRVVKKTKRQHDGAVGW